MNRDALLLNPPLREIWSAWSNALSSTLLAGQKGNPCRLSGLMVCAPRVLSPSIGSEWLEAVRRCDTMRLQDTLPLSWPLGCAMAGLRQLRRLCDNVESYGINHRVLQCVCEDHSLLQTMAAWLRPYEASLADFEGCPQIFQESSSASVFLLTSNTSQDFTTWIQEQDSDVSTGSGHTLLLPFDDIKLSITRSQIEKLVELWKIPRLVVAAPLKSHFTMDHIQPVRLRDPVGVTWYVHPLHLPVHGNKERHMTVMYSTFEDSETKPPGNRPLHNAIIYCPTDMVEEVENVIREYQGSEMLTTDNHMAIFRLILLLLEKVVLQWAVAKDMLNQVGTAAVPRTMFTQVKFKTNQFKDGILIRGWGRVSVGQGPSHDRDTYQIIPVAFVVSEKSSNILGGARKLSLEKFGTRSSPL